MSGTKAILATVTGKNQITIPAAVVRELRIEPGMKLEFELSGVRAVIVRPALTCAERVRQIEEKWQPLFPPGSDPHLATLPGEAVAQVVIGREEQHADDADLALIRAAQNR